jgi:hypothetical protein
MIKYRSKKTLLGAQGRELFTKGKAYELVSETFGERVRGSTKITKMIEIESNYGDRKISLDHLEDFFEEITGQMPEMK